MDWLGMILTLSGLVINGRKIIWCWLIWCIGDVVWIVYGIHTHQPAIVSLNTIMIGFNLWGWREWRNSKPS